MHATTMLSATALRLSSKTAAVGRPPSSLVRLFSSNQYPTTEKVKGVVYDFRRDKGYGSIHVKGTREVLFVHRSNLVCQVPLEHLPTNYPFLTPRERVSFTIEEDAIGKKHRRATRVTYANGKPIPVVRSNFLENALTTHNTRLGTSARAIFSNENWTPREEKLQELEKVWQGVVQEEQDSIQFLVQLGLDPEAYFVKRKPRVQNLFPTAKEEPVEQEVKTAEVENEPTTEKVEGIVYNFSGDKGLGSIRVKETQEVLFVHRSDLVCQVPLEHLPPKYPFLMPRERVSFTIQEDIGKKHRRATHVTFASGRPIPAVRSNFLESLLTTNTLRLGTSARAIFSKGWTREGKLEEMEKVWQGVLREEQEATQFLVQLGLDPRDYLVKRKPAFPTAKEEPVEKEVNTAEVENELPLWLH